MRSAQLASLPRRVGPFAAHEAGWAFYEEVLRPGFPSLPVVICSVNALRDSSRTRADGSNLQLIGKGHLSSIISAVDGALSSSVRLLPGRPVPPAVVTLDFERVNTALLAHLAKLPHDIHRINWATFEELVARLLRELGYEVKRTPLTRDGGVDIRASTPLA